MREDFGGQSVAHSDVMPVEEVVKVEAFSTPQRQIRGDKGNIDDLRHRSSEKLRLAWESIYHKFEDAHLEAQDEIYLGRRGIKGEEMRVIVDRGHLRSISKKTLEFGCFHIDEAEVIGYNQEEDQQVESEDSSPLRLPLIQSNRIEDSDLSEFLKAEAQRKHLYPSEDSEEEKSTPSKKSRTKSKPKVESKPMSACPGAGECTKSLCFLCGGIGDKSREEEDN